ncbi:hypothetical protein A1O1_07531 [Capronia coronata CBS 617.96]|uniref:DUF6594 domain-containing protein n=1 Tax=Capronia coronata CBS 617.96 TaxID=1182541 RepID=W9XTP0_9EURO|nr:uncharacterized protein A1O1_07531 [Capronia coronata CBS 617.96]EXJ83902.1 hypothetical protein A1O1_07531 [Capronia coronata CBS 617.96]
MATIIAPVELPTGRRSWYNNPRPGPDIYNPNWIPVLDTRAFNAATASLANKEVSAPPPASFSLFPSQTSSNSPKPRQGISHHYSKSALAPESVTSALRAQSAQHIAEPLPSIAWLAAHSIGTRESEKHRRSPTTGTGSSERQTTEGAQSLGEDVSATGAEEPTSVEGGDSVQQSTIQTQQVDTATRSSMTSTRRTAMLPPTSKYNRKPVASISSIRPSPGLLPQTPQESPRLAPSPAVQALVSPRMGPAEPPALESTSNVRPEKSTASERRQRALHSHPSDLSLRAHYRSRSDDAEPVTQPVSVRPKSRKSTDSRATTPRCTIYESQVPTPAPTTPLPELPPEVRRPPTREHGSPRPARTLPEGPIASNFTNTGPSDHAELASFMVAKNTIVFRRFDDVHVRLLLCLQDEIAQLEGELLKLESSTSCESPAERMLQKAKILRELRKLVGEYDQMFTTWSKMQTNKVSETTSKDLKQWLEKPATSAEAGLGISIQQDLLWLENSKDLSSLAVNDNENEKEKEQVSPESSTTGDPGSSGAGWKSFFNCAGKRK